MAKSNLLAVSATNPASPVAGFVGELITGLATLDANRDKKITWLEMINKVQLIGFKALSTFSGFDLAEFKEGIAELYQNTSARKELIEAFIQTFELTNREAEYLLEDFLRWLEQGVTLYNRLQALNKAKAA